jgi:hypothetical protein
MPDTPHFERALLVLLRKDGAIAFRQQDNGKFVLPLIEVAANGRSAQMVTMELRQSWCLDAVYLWYLPPVEPGGLLAHVAELISTSSLPTEWRWFGIIAPDCKIFLCSHILIANRARQIATTYSSKHPYAQIGWFDQLLEWTNDSLSGSRRSLTGNWSQVNGGRAFLAQFETSESGIWFKAPGDASQLEWEVTPRLTDVAPEWLPRIYARHQVWKGWLSEEVGQSLYHTTELECFNLAAEALGRLQRRFEDRTPWLLSIGVRDQRLPFLRSRIKPFMEMVQALMQMHIKELPSAMTTTQVQILGDQIDRAIDLLENLHLPNSLIHGDISPGSIISDGRRCAFIDWSRVYVGFPAVCCELMLNKFAPQLSGTDRWRNSLWQTYANQWPEYAVAFEPEQIKLSLALVSLLSYVFTKIEIDTWHDAPLQPVSPYFRGIARRMFAVAEQMTPISREKFHHA